MENSQLLPMLTQPSKASLRLQAIKIQALKERNLELANLELTFLLILRSICMILGCTGEPQIQ